MNKTTVNQQINFILNTFSLTVINAAKILKVPTKTIYTWKKSNEHNYNNRLLKIYKLALMYNKITSEPLEDSTNIPFIEDGKSIIDLLLEEKLNYKVIKEKLKLLAQTKKNPNLIILVGQKAKIWMKNIGANISETQQESNLEYNMRELSDMDYK